MLSKSKVFIALAFVLTLVVSSVTFSSTTEAYTGMAVYGGKFQKCFEVKLKNNRSGSIEIAMWPASNKIRNYTVKMEDEHGNYIWGEDGAISWNGRRNFQLGNDRKVYRIFIKANGCSGNVATATVTSSSNASVKVK